MEVIEEHKVGYTKTKLGWIPDDWDIVAIGDIAKIKHGRSQKEVEVEGGKYPILGTGGVIGWTNDFLYNKPSVMIGRKGTIDKPILMDTPFWTVDTLFYTHIKNGINPEWLFYNFQSIDWYRYNEATGVPSLSASNISKIKIPLPPEKERSKIASILSDWDEAIEKTQSLIKKLELRKKGLMQQLLTGKTRLKGFSEEWKEVRFGDIIVERKEFPLEPLPLYSLTIESGIIPKSERYERSFLLKSVKDAYKTMYKNDFALNPMNLRFGAIAKYNGEHKISVSKYYNIFHFSESCNSTYMEYYLSSYNMIQYYNKMAIGTLEEKKRVHYSDFINFKKTLPNLKEQNAIVEILNTADNEISYHKEYLEHLQSQKKGLMQQLLTGKTRVKVKK